MRKININNPEELKKFKKETTGFVSSYGFPYRIDDVTDKGANYTVFCPLRWKSAFSPAKLSKMLREEVDADRIKVEYIDFIQGKVMAAPEKLYYKEKERDDEVEYTRTDAFIEKAVEYLNEHFDYDCTSQSDCGYVFSDNYSSWEDFIEKFRKYMKG